MNEVKNPKSDRPKQDEHKSRIHITENPFTLHIDEEPDQLGRILMTAPPKQADEWRYKRD